MFRIETVPIMSHSRHLYLDKISTAPHVPNVEGQIGFISTDSFPDISHTGVQTKFRPYVPPAVTPGGKLRADYRTNTFEMACSLTREDMAANSTEITFKRSHKQFIDKVLLEMEEDRLRKIDRTLHSLSSTKAKLGLGEHFGTTKANSSSIPNEKKKIRVINRMALFESLLADSEAPMGLKRYGTISSPGRSSRRSANTLRDSDENAVN